MWHKRHRSQDDAAPAGKRLRDNIADLYSSGDVAGDRAQSLFRDAGEFARGLGSHEMQDLRGSASTGAAKNANRDLQRRLLKRSHWPPPYIQEVTSWSVKQKEEVQQKMAIMLPHEIVGVLSEVSDPEVMCQNAALDGTNMAKHAVIYEAMQCPFVSISLWGDGVPFSWDRKQSVEVWTLSFPGLIKKEYRDIRICLTAMPHRCTLKATQDDVFKILAWSFQALATGRYPCQRADGTPFLEAEGWRKKRAGQELLRGAVIEIKGDWKQLQQCFSVPGWMSSPRKPICWRCLASKEPCMLGTTP